MNAKLESGNDPIQLNGFEFRQLLVNCPDCVWQGVAGELQSIPDSMLANSVNYLCPDCAALVAMHGGLTQAEVLAELDRIKVELRNEFRDLQIEQELQIIDPNCRGPEFRKVRERFYGH